MPTDAQADGQGCLVEGVDYSDVNLHVLPGTRLGHDIGRCDVGAQFVGHVDIGFLNLNCDAGCDEHVGYRVPKHTVSCVPNTWA